jgi:enamine deaminase RidA (YjgF/YER057c/UK114 family)
LEMNEMAQVQRTAHNPPSAPQPIGAYSLAMEVSAGRLLFVAGQVGLDASGNLVGSGDAAAQTRQVFENIGQILSGVGASFDNVVELTTYVVGRESIQGFIQARTQIYPDIFSSGDYPPNTLLVVDGLVREEFLVEIKALAALP